MGRHRWTNRLTVEDCYALDVESLHRSGTFACPPGTVCTTCWGDSCGGIEAMLGFVVVVNPCGGLVLSIDPDLGNIHPAFKLPGKYLVPIATTRPHLGGKRYWFRCPALRDEKPCGKMVGRLYLPPGGQLFACRHCYDLTYKSAQQHDQRKYNLAMYPMALDAILGDIGSGSIAKRLMRAKLGLGGLALLGKWRSQGRTRQIAKVSGLIL
jgi:hypothetical protein